MRLALRHSQYSCCMWYWHPTWVPVQVPGALIPNQLPANAHGKSVKDGPSIWAPIPMWEDKFQAPGFSLVQLSPLQSFGSKPVDRNSLSCSLSLPLTQMCTTIIHYTNTNYKSIMKSLFVTTSRMVNIFKNLTIISGGNILQGERSPVTDGTIKWYNYSGKLFASFL